MVLDIQRPRSNVKCVCVCVGGFNIHVNIGCKTKDNFPLSEEIGNIEREYMNIDAPT